MMRFLYVRLLVMHPTAFRERFATEMLWIFDETRRTEGEFAMLLDCFFSLLRQWFLRSGYWKILVAFAGASLQFLSMGLCWHLPPIRQCSERTAKSVSHGIAGMGLLFICVGVATAVLITALAVRARDRIGGAADRIV